MKERALTGHPEGEPGDAPEAVDAAGLYQAHAGFVSGFLARMGVPMSDCADLVHEVFLVAHRRGGFVPGAARPTTWLAQIAVHVASTWRRSRRRRPEELVDADAVDETFDAESTASAREGLAQVQRCLEGLDEEHRVVFVLFELQGESCAEISEILGVPVGTVYSRLHHARKKFLDRWARCQVGERR